MKTTKEQEEKELRIKIIFDNNTSLTISVTEEMLNNITKVVGGKEGNFVHKCTNGNGFVCAFVPNKITYLCNA